MLVVLMSALESSPEKDPSSHLAQPSRKELEKFKEGGSCPSKDVHIENEDLIIFEILSTGYRANLYIPLFAQFS